jgi:opacity protein-like surface antigen
MIKAPLIAVALAVLVVSGISGPLPAAAQSADPAPHAWQFEIIPYLWLAGTSGDIRVGNLIDATIDASFSDILRSMDFGLMGAFQVRKGRVGFLFDGLYIKASKNGLGAGSPGEIVRAEVKMQLYSLAASYRILNGRIRLDIVGGARLLPVSAGLEVTSGVLEGSQASGSNIAVDGFVGAKLAFPLMNRLMLEAYADIGAGDSKLSWQTLTGLSYKLSRAVSAKLGYRYLGINNEKPNTQIKIGMGGIFAGVGILL